MTEYFIQFRAGEIRAEMLRDAAARQLVRNARTPRSATGILAGLRFRQRSASTAFATSRTPASMSDVVTCP